MGPERRRFMLHWAVYDSQQNLPVIYLMEVEDSGSRALPKDAGRWPAAQAHLMAQSSGGLKLLTIAKGFDTDFSDLHPKRLRRVYVGPMYSAGYTMQTGPIRQVLEGAKAGSEDDWALAWTVEELESERVEVEKGWFTDAEREVFKLDPLTGADIGRDAGGAQPDPAAAAVPGAGREGPRGVPVGAEVRGGQGRTGGGSMQ